MVSGNYDNSNEYKEDGKKAVGKDMIEVVKINQQDSPKLRGMAEKCYPLDVHTHYTYWVMSQYFADSSFIAKRGEQDAGYIMALYNEDRFFIWQIAILPEFRKQGIAYKLMDAVILLAKLKGFKRLEVTIDQENKSSYNMFTKYVNNKGYVMRKKEQIRITDLNDASFLEAEQMYEIILSKQ